MMWQRLWVWGVVVAVGAWLCAGAEEPNKEDQAKPAEKAGGGGGRGGGRRGGGPGGGGPGGGPGFAQGGGQGFLGRGGRAFDWMFNQMLGEDTAVKLDQLPYGPQRRFVLNVPVGGVDTLQDRGDGWKVEEIFTLTDEQGKAVLGLREQYKTELEKLQKQLDEANKAVALQVLALRQKYELLANDVMTGTAKEEKAKLDTLAKEFSEQRQAKAQERKDQVEQFRGEVDKVVAAGRENGNWEAMREIGNKAMEMSRGANDQTQALQKATLEKMKTAVTGDAKTKLEEKLQAVERRMADERRWQQDLGGRRGGGGPGGGGQGGGGGAPKGEQKAGEKPAAPPEGVF